MSTAKIEKALWCLQVVEGGRETETIREARAELEAIRKAARVLAVVDTGEVPRTAENRNGAHVLLVAIATEER